MPSLFRFLFTVCVLGGLLFGSMYILANYFEPEPEKVESSISGVKIRGK